MLIVSVERQNLYRLYLNVHPRRSLEKIQFGICLKYFIITFIYIIVYYIIVYISFLSASHLFKFINSSHNKLFLSNDCVWV